MTIHSHLLTTWNDSPVTILPTVKYLIDSGIKLWIYRHAHFHYNIIVNTYDNLNAQEQ